MRVEGARLDSVAGGDFVNPGTQFLEHEGERVRFATHTRGDTSSLRLRLSQVQRNATVLLDLEEARETGSAPPFYRPPATIPASQVRLPLADMRRGRLERSLPVADYPDDGIVLRQVVNNGPREVEFSYVDDETPRQGDYYYVRVRQMNDAMAWSSPIWVGGYPSR